MKAKTKRDTGAAVSLKIEKGVALPPKVVMGSLSPTSRAMLEMDAGDSFLVPGKKPETVMGTVRAMNARMRKAKKPNEFTARRMSDGVRVWRVKWKVGKSSARRGAFYL